MHWVRTRAQGDSNVKGRECNTAIRAGLTPGQSINSAVAAIAAIVLSFGPIKLPPAVPPDRGVTLLP
jgi:hypothetical protein